jgi:uncharacterized membrane protein
MKQDARNKSEWAKPENWSGPKWLSLYFSRYDSRVWVPKQVPTLGWTINLGHRRGVLWLLGLLLLAILLVVMSNVAVIKWVTK